MSTQSEQYLHTLYTISTHSVHSIYTLSTYYLHTIVLATSHPGQQREEGPRGHFNSALIPHHLFWLYFIWFQIHGRYLQHYNLASWEPPICENLEKRFLDHTIHVIGNNKNHRCQIFLSSSCPYCSHFLGGWAPFCTDNIRISLQVLHFQYLHQYQMCMRVGERKIKYFVQHFVLVDNRNVRFAHTDHIYHQ